MSLDIEKLINLDIRKSANGSYSPFTLNIEVDGKTNEENSPTLFHEYTHYLQNFTTFQGLVRFEDYTTYFLNCFTKLGIGAANPMLPLKDYAELQNAMGDKNLYNLNNQKAKGMYRNNDVYEFYDYEGNDYEIIIDQMVNNYTGKMMDIPFIILDDKKIPINEIVIKENMALCNTIIASVQRDELLENEIQQVLEIEYKEYVVLLDFINNFLGSKYFIQITYKLCEMILNILPITKSAYDILTYIKDNHVRLRKLKVELIIQDIYEAFDFQKYIVVQHEAYKKIVNKKIKILSEIVKRDRNEFVKILINFYKYIIEGISIRLQRRSLYTPFLSNEYMGQFVGIIGCPIIYYTATKQVVMLVDVPDYFTSDFAYLHAALKLFILCYESEINKCPFNISGICKITKNQNCDINCFENYTTAGYENCLLTNALNCTGIRSDNRT